jgi:signal transduction histidine kinase
MQRFQSSFKEAEAASDRDIALDAILGSASALLGQGNIEAARLKLEQGQTHLSKYLDGIGLVTQRRFARGSGRIYQQMGFPNEAIERLTEWHKLDSLIQGKNIVTALQTQAALIRSESDLELEQLKVVQANADMDVLRTRQFLYLTLGMILILTLIMIYVFRRRKQIQQEALGKLELIQAKQEKAISELKIRDQVGRDLHDDLGAGLSALKLKCEMALRMEKDPSKVQSFRSISHLSKEIMESMRQVIWSLNMDLDSLDDLVVYMTNYARNYLAENHVVLELRKDDHWPDISLSPEQRRNVFLVVKEALHNTVKHADATKVEFHIHWKDGLNVKLKDNGIGMKSSNTSFRGNGLKNMNKRLSDLGSVLNISGEKGTEVSFRLKFTSNKSSIPILN